eukprot:146914_1
MKSDSQTIPSFLCLNLIMIILWLLGIDLSFGYLNNQEINTLNDIYNAWNGPFWSGCSWNMHIINDTNTENYIINHCGLFFGNHSIHNYQFVDGIDFNKVHITINNMTGTIPSTIANLSNLTLFRLFYNELYGTIPYEFCNIHSLKNFYIYGNDFNGLISECLFNLSQIEAIAFGNTPNISINSRMLEILCNNHDITNRFDFLQFVNVDYIGSIPECIGYKLTNIGYLGIDSISSLNGTIP